MARALRFFLIGGSCSAGQALRVFSKLDGLYVELMEKGAVVCFWSEGRFRKIRVSD